MEHTFLKSQEWLSCLLWRYIRGPPLIQWSSFESCTTRFSSHVSHVPIFLYHTLLCPGVIWRNLKSDQFRYKVKRDFDCSGDRKVGPLGISTWILHQWALTPYLENSQNYWKYIENIQAGEFRKLRTYVYPAWPHKTRIKILRNRNRNMTLLPALPSPSTT